MINNKQKFLLWLKSKYLKDLTIIKHDIFEGAIRIEFFYYNKKIMELMGYNLYFKNDWAEDFRENYNILQDKYEFNQFIRKILMEVIPLKYSDFINIMS